MILEYLGMPCVIAGGPAVRMTLECGAGLDPGPG